MFLRSRSKFRTTWQGRPLEVVVSCRLPDEAAFRRDIELIGVGARSFGQVTRDLNELAQENTLVVSFSRAGGNGIRAEMRSAV